MCPETSTTGRMAGGRIGTSRNHSTGTGTTITGSVNSSGINTEPSTRLCSHLTPSRTNTGMCPCGANRDITTATANEAEGSTVSAKEAEGVSTEKKKNGAAEHRTLSDSRINTNFSTRLCTHHKHNGASCQSQRHNQSSRRVVIDNSSKGGNCISGNTSNST